MTRAKKRLLTSRFEDALVFTAQLHAQQRRKGGQTPYLSHLMSVAALVLEDGGGEDEAIAALLHDSAEDQGGKKALEKIRSLFGNRVAEIVLECSDSMTTPKPRWKARKLQHIEHIRSASPEAQRVISADKLHNARSVLRDLRSLGSSTWDKFLGGKDGTLWYYRAVQQALNHGSKSYLLEELERVITKIEKLA
ncbi:MAG: HD domain-containing protein [Chloroflexi bacterium]|nr:HD domain-containing protein [Chloroflexota bacterium]